MGTFQNRWNVSAIRGHKSAVSLIRVAKGVLQKKTENDSSTVLEGVMNVEEEWEGERVNTLSC